MLSEASGIAGARGGITQQHCTGVISNSTLVDLRKGRSDLMKGRSGLMKGRLDLMKGWLDLMKG